MTSNGNPPAPVEGEAIGCSKKAVLERIYGAIAICTCAFAVVWLWWNETTFTFGTQLVRLGWWTTPFAAAGVAAAVFLAGTALNAILKKQRLIIGKDCLQIVTNVSGQDQVVFQLPYSSISEISCPNDKVIVIALKNLNDPRNYGSKRYLGSVARNSFICVSEIYLLPPKEIFQRMITAKQGLK
jgi:hypothetical protein